VSRESVPEWLVPAAFGAVRLLEGTPVVRSGSRSYTHDGRYLDCTSAEGYEVACDIESIAAPAADYLARELRLEVPDFLRFWTQLEVCAKLLRASSAALFARHRKEPWPASLARAYGDVELRTTSVGDLVISVGWRRRRPTTRRSSDQPAQTLPAP
jgi:hypothetical protein